MSWQQQERDRKVKAQGAIEALEYIMETLCSCELSHGGRKQIKKTLVKYEAQL